MHIQMGKNYEAMVTLGTMTRQTKVKVTVTEIAFGRESFKCTIHKTGQSYWVHEVNFIKEITK